jgi:predicted AlkP superfamily pyrophosphatase or phosphodiesterase
MINRKPFFRFKWLEKDQLVKPIYQDCSFANIHPTIIYLLSKEQKGNLLAKDCFVGNKYPNPKKIILFLIDAFGFDSWQKYYKKFNLLKKITNEGMLTPISAIFPSTTAASVSTLILGILPSQHALFEWNLYIEKYDDVIQTLPFSPLGDESIDGCLKLGYDPKYLLNRHKTIYQELKKAGVKSYCFDHRDYANSSYNKIISQGATFFSYSKLAEGLINLQNLIKDRDEKMFVNFYLGDIDSISHKYGPGSLQHEAQIAEFWLIFEYIFSDFQKDKDILFLFTADHGQIGINPKNTFYLNLEIPQIVNFLKVNKKGKIIYPCGSPRDVFLHVKEEKVDELFHILQKRLQDKVKTLLIKDVLKMGLFGDPPFHKEFIKRLGQILLLPYKNNYVWWYEKDKLKSKHFGNHGGLTKEEMITVFTAF